MTTVRYSPDDLTLEVEGHADSAMWGVDIVCAAISILEQTLLRNLMILHNKGDCELDYEHSEPGHSRMHAVPKNWARVKIKQMYEFTMEGLRMLCWKYPEHVTVKEG